jgi:hypothetical protein
MISDIRAILNYGHSIMEKHPKKKSEIQTLIDISLLELEEGALFTEEYNKLVTSIEDLINE